jgi:secreted trypsin-like serine protease
MRLGSTCLLAVLAHGIVIRDDKNDSDYVINAAEYPAVFSYPAEMGLGDGCTATLINPRHAITASHCFSSPEMKVFLKGKFRVDINGEDYNVLKVIRNPCFSDEDDGPNSADMAILVLEEDVDVKPYSIYDKCDEIGSTFTLIGWGQTMKAGPEKPDNTSGG